MNHTRFRSMSRAAGPIAATIVAACGIPGLPPLPEPGAPAAAPTLIEDGTRTTPGPAAVGDEQLGTDCFQRHLREAISINERREPLYASWTDGRSVPISRRLIRAERAALLAAWYVDGRARRFQRAGVPIGCAEFVSMSLTPLPGAGPREPPAAPYRPGPGPDSLTGALVGAYGQGGFAAVADAADRVLDALHSDPHYHCMVRHLVESIRLLAVLASRHAAAADTAGLPSTVPLSELLLRLHLAVLPAGHQLDRDAAPLQANGVPILCRDVPPIPRPE